MLNFWNTLGLRARLNLGLCSLLALSLALAATLVVEQARRAVHTEVHSALSVGQEILHGQLAEAHAGQALVVLEQLTRTFSASRHVCWQWRPMGAPLGEDTCSDQKPAAPAWFQRGLNTELGEYQTRFANYELRLLPQIGPELEEAWREVRGLLMILLAFGLFTLTLVGALIQRSLRPIAALAQHIRELDSQTTQSSRPAYYPRELQPIAEGIASLQTRLTAAREDHHQLLQRCFDHHQSDRERWAQDLHDRAGQWIAAIAVEAAALQQQDLSPEQLSHGLARIRQSTQCLHEQTRRLARQLHRPHLGAPLGIALEQLCQHWQDSSHRWVVERSIDAHCDNLAANVAVHVYGIAQEALSNAAKHANARHIRLNLARHANRWTLIIEDDGVGLDAQPQCAGLGLEGMRQRARDIDAELNWSRPKNGGTMLSLALPA